MQQIKSNKIFSLNLKYLFLYFKFSVFKNHIDSLLLETIDHLTCSSKDEAKENRHDNKVTIPNVFITNNGDSKVHEDDRLTDGRQHLHEILNGCMRFK